MATQIRLLLHEVADKEKKIAEQTKKIAEQTKKIAEQTKKIEVAGVGLKLLDRKVTTNQ